MSSLNFGSACMQYVANKKDPAWLYLFHIDVVLIIVSQL